MPPKKGAQIFLTITFAHLPSSFPHIQFAKTIREVYSLLNEIAQKDTINIYPEITENSNIHYHVIFTLDKSTRYHGKVLPIMKRDMGWCKSVEIRNLTKVIDYCTKDFESMKDLLKSVCTAIPITSPADFKDIIYQPLYDITDYSKGLLPIIKHINN